MNLVLVLALFISSCAARHAGGSGPAASAGESGTHASRELRTTGIANVFSPKERSSSDANATLLACMAEVANSEHGNRSEPHVQAWYCVCMTDALGVYKDASVDVDKAASVCVPFAMRMRKKAPVETRTPYSGRSFLNAGQISGSQQGCVKKAEVAPKTQALSAAQKEIFCSCLVDSMRFRRTASTSVPVDVTRTCAEAAHWHW